MARKDKKTSKLESAEAVLMKLFEAGKSPLSGQFLRWKLWQKWPEVVGETISKVTEPVGYHRGVLYIWVKNSAWMQQLFFIKDDLRAKVNDQMGANWARSVRLTLDRKSVPTRAEAGEDLHNFLSKQSPSEGGERSSDR